MNGKKVFIINKRENSQKHLYGQEQKEKEAHSHGQG